MAKPAINAAWVEVFIVCLALFSYAVPAIVMGANYHDDCFGVAFLSSGLTAMGLIIFIVVHVNIAACLCTLKGTLVVSKYFIVEAIFLLIDFAIIAAGAALVHKDYCRTGWSLIVSALVAFVSGVLVEFVTWLIGNVIYEQIPDKDAPGGHSLKYGSA